MGNSKPVALSYGLLLTGGRWDVVVEATSFDARGNALTWAVRKHRFCLSNKTGEFDYEPLPSSRSGVYFKEYRFDSMEKAVECYRKYYG